MNPKPRDILRGLIEKYGSTLLSDPRRCEALLRDLCGDHKREISVLVSALRERVPNEIVAPSQLLPAQCLYERLASRLEEDLALSPDASRWAVSAWTFALDHQEPIWNQPTLDAAGAWPHLSRRNQAFRRMHQGLIGFTLKLESSYDLKAPTLAQLHDATDALTGCGSPEFLILEGHGNDFVQAAIRLDNDSQNYVAEWREYSGDKFQHFQTVGSNETVLEDGVLGAAEVKEILEAFVERRGLPARFVWVELSFPE